MRADFECAFHDSSSAHQIIVNKLCRVAARVKRRILICIDGWNEASVHAAQQLDRECARLSANNIQIVLSMTTVAASRLLLDGAGNPSAVASAIGAGRASIPLIEMSPREAERHVALVTLSDYSADETEAAYRKYPDVYRVSVPDDHHKTHDPFLLRNAMDIFRGKCLPAELNHLEILEHRLREKITRTV
jgi:hypothetical protein